MAALGFVWTELGPYGYLPTDLSILQHELRRRGLKLCAGVLMPHLEDGHQWPQIREQALLIVEALACMQAPFLVLIDDMYCNQKTGRPQRDPKLDDDAWKVLVETSHKVAQLAKDEAGLRTVLHPHAETHVEYEDQIERFLHDTDAGLINLGFDTGHHAYRRADPIAFVRQHHARIDYLHLKTVDAERLETVVYREGGSMAEALVKGVFCEPDQGSVDFVALSELLLEINYEGFAIIEQDSYALPFDSLKPIAKRSLVYYQGIGMGMMQ